MNVSQIIKYLATFLLLILFQVSVLNNIKISSLGITPFMYVLIILTLPFEIRGWILLLVGFFTGFVIDMFLDTAGLHTAATTFMAFSRPLVLNTLSPRDGYESGTYPTIHFQGFVWFLSYSLYLVVLHHFVYFFIEAFSFGRFHITLLKIFFSTIFSCFIIVLSQYFILRK